MILRRVNPSLRRTVGLTILRRAIDRHVSKERTYGGRIEVRATATPALARQRNLDGVLDLLDRAGVPYLCLPTATVGSLVVVDDVHATLVRRLLWTEAVGQGACVRTAPQPNPTAPEGTPVPLDVFWLVSDPRRYSVLAREYACHVQFWRREETQLVDPWSGVPGDALSVTEPAVLVPQSVLTPHAPRDDNGRRVATHVSSLVPVVDRVTFPIDVVYTWADRSDPGWLRYSLRSVYAYAPWVSRIFLVTDNHAPAWLDQNHPMVTVVPHAAIFADVSVLPTFNPYAIESQLHRIPGLAEHFLYLTDDMFLGRPVPASLFFHANGTATFFPSSGRIGRAPASAGDPPFDAAAKNNRARITQRFGRGSSNSMRHVPHPLLRGVLEEISTELAEDVAAMGAHRFQEVTDLSIATSLAHDWAFQTSRAVPGRIRYLCAELGKPHAAIALTSLLHRRSYDVFSIDATTVDAEAAQQWAPILATFLAAYFPFAAPFERPDDLSAATRYSTNRLEPDHATEPVASNPDF